VMRSIIANLTPASGRQDHTISPYASASLVHAHKYMTTLSRPPQPAPDVSDDGRRPLYRDGMTEISR